jgi:hypothetical protein
MAGATCKILLEMIDLLNLNATKKPGTDYDSTTQRRQVRTHVADSAKLIQPVVDENRTTSDILVISAA